ncbi:hypothetical protein JOY44_07485 [Phormidium sp. CLA17]|uniref:slr1601 family putative cell division protein n=1 Tax=Leptolyngbya sp. Cla-17 TaxID=2803751 RepID=UPI0014923C9E|nr:hypothetical protein [Leptolyngbya sp. Cla-17]MBM0741456.1 hypothetical protein [Leptolyngbya sp. Cla-17]
MYALKPPTPTPQSARPLRVVPKARAKAKPRRKTKPYRAIACETVAKITVNAVLSIAAIGALFQLLPYRSSQEIKLQELQAAVKSTGSRVQQVQSKFSYYFDPSQARESMQELTGRIDPQRRQIVWKAPAPAAVKALNPPNVSDRAGN